MVHNMCCMLSVTHKIINYCQLLINLEFGLKAYAVGVHLV